MLKKCLPLLLLCTAPVFAKPVLTVYTYDSFAADWGPGPVVKKAFEADCNCELKLVALEDGVSLLNRLRMEGKNSKADAYSGHLMTEKTDRNGDTYRWEYDSKGRCVHTYGTDGMMEGRIEYHPSEGYNLVTDSTGGTTTYRYTPDQLVTSEIDPLGNETRHSYTDFMETETTVITNAYSKFADWAHDQSSTTDWYKTVSSDKVIQY